MANPGFETNTGCPTLSSQIALAVPWDTPTDSSPDYFHSCGTSGIRVPSNFWGNAPAYEGEAYAALIAFNDLTLEREYIQEPLAQPLVIGATYQVTFHVSLAENSEFAVDRIGAAFHSGPVDGDGSLGRRLFHFPTFAGVVKVEAEAFPAPVLQMDNVCITLLPVVVTPALPPAALVALAFLLCAAAGVVVSRRGRDASRSPRR